MFYNQNVAVYFFFYKNPEGKRKTGRPGDQFRHFLHQRDGEKRREIRPHLPGQ